SSVKSAETDTSEPYLLRTAGPFRRPAAKPLAREAGPGPRRNCTFTALRSQTGPPVLRRAAPRHPRRADDRPLPRSTTSPLTHWLQTTSFCSDESYQAVLAEIHAARNVPYAAQPAPRTNPRQTGGVLGRDPTFHRGALSERASAGRSNCCVLSTTYTRAT